MNYKLFALASLVAAAAASQADVLFWQGPDTGNFSGSWSNQTGSQNFADVVELNSAATVTQYDYFTNFDPSTFGTMTVKLLADGGGTPGSLLSSESVSVASYSDYGSFGGNEIYEVVLHLSTPWALSANTVYWAGASGDGFEAAQASIDHSNNGFGDGMMAQFSGGSFTNMTSVGDQDFALEGGAAPEPASFAVLALGAVGLVARRRRR